MLLQIDTLSEVINEVVNTGLQIHSATGGGQIINGVDNGVIGGIATLLITAVIRFFEKRKIHKKYKNGK